MTVASLLLLGLVLGAPVKPNWSIRGELSCGALDPTAAPNWSNPENAASPGPEEATVGDPVVGSSDPLACYLTSPTKNALSSGAPDVALNQAQVVVTISSLTGTITADSWSLRTDSGVVSAGFTPSG